MSLVVLGTTMLELAVDCIDSLNDCGELGGDCPPDHDCHDCTHCIPRVAVEHARFVLAPPRPLELDVIARPHADRRPPSAPPREILVVPRAT